MVVRAMDPISILQRGGFSIQAQSHLWAQNMLQAGCSHAAFVKNVAVTLSLLIYVGLLDQA